MKKLHSFMSNLQHGEELDAGMDEQYDKKNQKKTAKKDKKDKKDKKAGKNASKTKTESEVK